MNAEAALRSLTCRPLACQRTLQDEKKRKLLKVRLEMAKFLQETIRESGIKSPDKIKESEDFKEFFRKVRWQLVAD